MNFSIHFIFYEVFIVKIWKYDLNLKIKIIIFFKSLNKIIQKQKNKFYINIINNFNYI